MLPGRLSAWLFAFATTLSLLAAPAWSAEPQAVTLDVPGMTCAACPITVRLALKRVPGVISATADFDSKTATVRFDPDRTDVQALIRATTEAGYPSRPAATQ
ncbi:mercury resistance system periplasmic binding protein MerP [Thiohalobacter sp. IOR34]|uniref:mercury resistance system periplasmic binding protein MerP n=1 Tax=Thiohalobacter sp. IOR34 TaxID=3057176 RepID=UPI0025B27ECE|nr:mercury resistance system periplasmic binding protein MerP [Thiohalobacter sp. IOR34]WJW76680.1 mercury resistance system periplasmic binding protein MerP [Thiohalobacter sp. IOR34]